MTGMENSTIAWYEDTRYAVLVTLSVIWQDNSTKHRFNILLEFIGRAAQYEDTRYAVQVTHLGSAALLSSGVAAGINLSDMIISES